jgi:hypothetical protein
LFSFSLPVLRLGLLQDEKVRVGVFSDCQIVPIGSLCLGAVCSEEVCGPSSKPANAAIGSFCTIPEWVKNFLKVGNNFIVPKPSREWSDAQTNGIEVSEVKATAPGSANS